MCQTSKYMNLVSRIIDQLYIEGKIELTSSYEMFCEYVRSLCQIRSLLFLNLLRLLIVLERSIRVAKDKGFTVFNNKPVTYCTISTVCLYTIATFYFMSTSRVIQYVRMRASVTRI